MLRGAGAALAGGASTALLLDRATDSGHAATTDLAVTGDDVVIRQGTLASIWLDATVDWSYAVPSGERPSHVVVELRAGTDGDDLTVVGSAQSNQAFLEASGSEAFEVDLLAEDVLAADALVPSEPGASVATEVVVGAELRLIDESEMVIAADSRTDTATIAIEKSDYDPDDYGTVGGHGNVTVTVE
jgi:hypothetical protein